MKNSIELLNTIIKERPLGSEENQNITPSGQYGVICDIDFRG